MFMVLVTGDRKWTDRYTIYQVLSRIAADHSEDQLVLVHGDADGADTIAAEVGKELGFAVVPMEADWNRYKKAAGPIRNRKMLDLAPDEVHAFHDDLTQSKGTRNCVEQARKLGYEPYLHRSQT
jgi:hypothetical protein